MLFPSLQITGNFIAGATVAVGGGGVDGGSVDVVAVVTAWNVVSAVLHVFKALFESFRALMKNCNAFTH